jgi:hypothetical protein
MEAHHDYSVFADNGVREIMKIAELQKSLKLVNEEMCHCEKREAKKSAEG